MKRSAALLLLSVSATLAASAQNVPALMNFQSQVLDANGQPLGAVSPLNREITLRIYDVPSGGVSLYAERQVATIAGGDFSLLLGNGDAVGGEPKPALASVFNGTIRYLGVTVDDGTAAADGEISPRQQIVSTAFAFQAQNALNAQNAQTVPPANVLASLSASGLQTSGNRIGINTPNLGNPLFYSSPAQDYRLTVRGDNTDPGQLANQITVQSESFGGRKLFVGYHNVGNYGSIQPYDEAGGGPTNLILNPVGGRVGVGTTTPAATLAVRGQPHTSTVFLQAPASGSTWADLAFVDRAGTAQAALQLAGAAGDLVAGSAPGDVFLRSFSNRLFLQAGQSSGPGVGLTVGSNNLVGINVSVPSAMLDVFANGTVPAAAFQNGNVGIGTATPASPLTVRGTLPQVSLLSAAGNVDCNFAVFNTGGTANGPGASIQTNNGFGSLGLNPLGGNVGVNTNAPRFPFEVNGTVNFQIGPGHGVSTNSGEGLVVTGVDHNQLTLKYSGHGSHWRVFGNLENRLYFERITVGAASPTTQVYIADNGELKNLSDRRLKKDIAPLSGVLDRVTQLRPVSYQLNSLPDDSPRSLGFIAQEVEPLFPEVVETNAQGIKSMGYSGLIPVAIGAVQEVNAKAERLAAENAALQARLSAVEARLAALEAALAAASAK